MYLQRFSRRLESQVARKSVPQIWMAHGDNDIGARRDRSNLCGTEIFATSTVERLIYIDEYYAHRWVYIKTKESKTHFFIFFIVHSTEPHRILTLLRITQSI